MINLHEPHGHVQEHFNAAFKQLPYPIMIKNRVCTGPGILLWHFPGLESPGKRLLVLESSGNLLNSTKNYVVYGRQ